MSKPVSPDLDAFENQLIELLYRLDEEGEVQGFFVDTFRGDEYEEEIVARIDSLTEILGVAATAWTGACLGGTSENLMTSWRISRGEMRHHRLNGTSIGKYLVDQAFEALPIESQEEGEGNVRLSLAVDDNRVLTFRSKGFFDTTYPDDEASDKESELTFNIAITADVHTIAP